jgi:hypothetical protein
VGGVRKKIAAIGSRDCLPTRINRRGEIVGAIEAWGGNRAFLYSRGKLHILGTVGRGASKAWCVNNLGIVAGQEGVRGFIYSRGRKTYLDEQSGEWAPGWMIGVPIGINDKGQMIATAYNPKGDLRAVLLTPDR